jgi:DNA repair exonuclease SbcCD ATPase subunit
MFDVIRYWDKNIPNVKADLISSAIPYLQDIANDFLAQVLSGYTIEFIVDPARITDKLDIIITDTEYGVSRPIEGWSGGEQQRMSLAVYVALNRLAYMRSKKSLNFIIMDEKLIGVDIDSRSTILEAIREEFSGRKVIFISHIQSIEHEFRQVIKVEKKNRITKYEIIS